MNKIPLCTPVNFKNFLPTTEGFYLRDRFYIFPIYTNNKYSEYIVKADVKLLCDDSVYLVNDLFIGENNFKEFMKEFPDFFGTLRSQGFDEPYYDHLYVHILNPEYFLEIISQMKCHESSDLGIDEITYLNDTGDVTGIAIIVLADA